MLKREFHGMIVDRFGQKRLLLFTIFFMCMLENAIEAVFNHKAFKQTVRSSSGYITVGYARKSISNDSMEKRTNLLQKMINNLHNHDLCEKVYVSPVCSADSELATREQRRSSTATTIMEQLRFHDGDMQGKGKWGS